MSASRSQRQGDRLTWLGATLVVLVLGLVTPASSHAFWQHSAPPVTASLSAARVPAPAGVVCNSRPNLLSPYVQLQWNHPAGIPAASIAGYEVWLRDETGTTRTRIARADPAALSEEIRSSLGDLVGHLLELLLGGKPVYAEVVTVHASGWTSAPSAGVPIVRTGLLPGVLGGLKCA